jgi:hypothetical protein
MTIINLEQAISEDPLVKRVAIGPPIAVFLDSGSSPSELGCCTSGVDAGNHVVLSGRYL